MAPFEPVAPVKFLGPVDGLVEITEPVEGVRVFSEILVPGVLGLVELFGLPGEVAESLLVALDQGSTVVVPVLQGVLVSLCGQIQFPSGPASGSPTQARSLGFGDGLLVVVRAA